jgi:hypothetical protein
MHCLFLGQVVASLTRNERPSMEEDRNMDDLVCIFCGGEAELTGR